MIEVIRDLNALLDTNTPHPGGARPALTTPLRRGPLAIDPARMARGARRLLRDIAGTFPPQGPGHGDHSDPAPHLRYVDEEL